LFSVITKVKITDRIAQNCIALKNEQHFIIDSNFDHQMSPRKWLFWYSNYGTARFKNVNSYGIPTFPFT